MTSSSLVRALTGSLIAGALASCPVHASAQVTLLVRDDASVALDASTGADEALRAATGASVRRLDASLEDLALAAGCPDTPESNACVASLAAAARAEWLVIERTSRAPSGWHVVLELRRGATGARARRLDVSCGAHADCVAALTVALRPATAPTIAETSTVAVAHAPPVTTTDVAPAAPHAPHEPPPLEPVPEPEPARAMPIVAQVLFVSAAAVSVGAMIAGGIGLQQGHDAWAIGTITRPEMADRAAALEASRDVALGFGTALAITGACLAIAAVVMMVVERPRSEHAVHLGGAVSGTAAMLSLDGRF